MSGARTPRVVGERRWVNASFGALAWVIGLVFFFPVFWMVLNSFKSEQDANTAPKLFFSPTLDRYKDVTESAGGLLSFGQAFTNSAVIVLVSVTIVMLLAIPAAYALAIRPVPKWRDVLFFFISTKFLPIVAAILPIWILAKNLDLLNTRLGLIILYVGINLPLAVWMLRSFFQEIPRELVEAAEIDADCRSRDCRDGAAVRDLRLERVLLRRPAEPGERLDGSDLGHDERQHARRLPRQAVGGLGAGVHSRRARRLDRPEAHDPRPGHGCHQVRSLR
jgi:hypothetical protein